MKKYNSMYLGLCINNDDPQKRGRVQVFIPHIMPALYKGWNEDGKDIEISCVGDNIEGALPSDVLERLKKILPWAEAAAPIFGTSAPGNAVSSGGSTFYNQSPVPEPPTYAGTGTGDLAGSALGMIGTSTANIPGTQGGGVGCAAAVSMMFKNATGQDIIPGRSIVLGTSELYSHMSSSNNWVRVPIDQMQSGDVLVTGRGSRAGHTGIYVGNGRIVSNSSSGFNGSAPGTIQNNYSIDSWKSGVITRNPGASGVFRYVGPTNGASGSTYGTNTTATGAASTGMKYTSQSGQTAAGANPHQSPQGAPTMTETGTNQYGVNADPTTGQAASIASNTAPSLGADASGISAGALEYAMRIAAAETGANGTNSGNSTAKYINNINNTIAMSQGIKNGYEVRGASFARINEIANTLKSQGKVNPSVLDVGYTQHNANDMKAYGIKNSGSYRDQILSVARHVQNQANKNPSFATALNSGNFAVAESLNGGKIVPGWNTSIYKNSHINNKNQLSSLIDSQYSGDPYRALEGLNQAYPATPDLNTMLAEGFDPNSSATAGGSSALAAGDLGINTNLVNNTNSYGPVAQVNVNNMAKGLFSYPAAGAMLWCFFREGNPLYPVYFGVSYSSSEWASAYRTASPGLGYNPNPQNGAPASTGGALNLNGSGGLYWHNTTSLEDPSKDEKVITLFGEDGSNLFFGAGLTQFYSKFNRRDQVDGDLWQTTLGFKEEWVQGDSNQVVMGDLIVKVGNVGQPAVDAVTRIQEIIKEIQKPLSQSS